jgi:hypothetical protein
MPDPSLDRCLPLGERAALMMRSPLSHFVLVGLGLFIVQGLWTSSAGPDRMRIDIRRSEIVESISDFEAGVGRIASNDERRALEDQIIEKALWLAQAKALGLHRTDPVVRQRLIQSMRLLETGAGVGEDALLARALKLEMESSDPVLQRRLIDRVQALLRAGVRSQTPSDRELRTHYEENVRLWREPALLDLSHVYVSRDERSAKSAADVFQILTAEGSYSESAAERGDRFLSGHHLRSASPAQIAARLGPRLAAATRNAPTMKWIGPVESSFGLHLVWIHKRVDSGVPHYEAIRTRVLENWFEQEAGRRLRRELARHRANADIRILDDLDDHSSANGRPG